LDDLTFVVTGSEMIEIDDFLNIGVHVMDEVELNTGLKESSIDLVETIMEDSLADHR
jgi:hypothetical protein